MMTRSLLFSPLLLLLTIGCKEFSGSLSPGLGTPITAISGRPEWQTMNGPTDAYTFCMATHPSGAVFAGTENGMYRLSPGDSVWKIVPLNSTYPDGRCITFGKDGEVYAGSESGMIFRSTDLGDHWTNIASGLSSSFITALIVTPNGYILAGSALGVHRSTDNGSTWSTVNSEALKNVVIYTFFLTGGNDILAGGDGGSGIFRSTDNGGFWTIMNTTADGITATSFAADKQNRLFASTWHDGAYYSTDNGHHWKYSGLKTIGSVNQMGRDSAGAMLAMTSGGIYREAGSGTTWSAVEGIPVVPGGALRITVGPTGHLYAGINSNGVYRSTNNGVSWKQFNFGLHPVSIEALACDNNGNIIAGSYGWGSIFLSTDEGASWERKYQFIGWMAIRSVLIDKQGTMLGGTDVGGILSSTDNGAHWSTTYLNNNSNAVTALAEAPNGNIIAGTENGRIYRSFDHGKSWSVVDTADSRKRINSFFSASGTLFACTQAGGIFASADNGETWSPRNTGLATMEARALCLSSSGELFLGTWGGGVFSSRDMGATWTRSDRYPAEPYIMSVAMTLNGTLYAGIGHDGVMRSSDGGKSWTKCRETFTPNTLLLLPSGRVMAGAGGTYRNIP